MTIDDIFTKRAQKNLDLLLHGIQKCSPSIQSALMLCLTAASGQMTKMVFAVTGRGKKTGDSSESTEVGSWVIGYWRPTKHFEVNVWNCYENRVRRLLKAIENGDPLQSARLSSSASDVLSNAAEASVSCGDCRVLTEGLPDQSVDLVITDPPHSDRIPYLELSEMWNSILRQDADFEKEIVYSNAKERAKDETRYNHALTSSLNGLSRVLSRHGFLVVLFNARQESHWTPYSKVCRSQDSPDRPLQYLGCFPCSYSAGSVVQDNRKGSLKSDYALVFSRSDADLSQGFASLSVDIQGWSDDLPPKMKNGSPS